jgi:iron complex outermembrane receptor protein
MNPRSGSTVQHSKGGSPAFAQRSSTGAERAKIRSSIRDRAHRKVTLKRYVAWYVKPLPSVRSSSPLRRYHIVQGGLILFGMLTASTPALAQTSETNDTSDIIVTGSIYRGNVTSGGARIDADVRDLPLSISVLTSALIEDRQIRSLRQLADNVAGVQSRLSGSGALSVDFTVRGLRSIGGTTSVNGYRIGTVIGDRFSTGFDPQTVERVEFLKGPASVLYGGNGSLAGLVNIVTKTPRSDDFLVVDATGGTRDYGRLGLDGNVRLTDTLDARFNAALTHEEYPNAFRPLNAQSLSPAILWHPSSAFSLLLEGTYFHSVQPTLSALSYPSIERFLEVPKTFKWAEKWDRDENTGYRGRLEANWSMSPTLTLHAGINLAGYREKEIQQYYPDSPNLLSGPDLLNRQAIFNSTRVRAFTVQNELRWSVETGSIGHKLLLGYEHGRETYDYPMSDLVHLPPLSLTGPTYGAPKPPMPPTQYIAQSTTSDGAYIQDFIQWRRFKALVGLRYDRVRSSAGFCFYSTPGCEQRDPTAIGAAASRSSAISPRAGLAWQPTSATTIYGSYSQSFNPSAFIDRDGKPLPVERGTQYEIGLRQDFFAPGRLTLSLAAFHLTRSNIPRCDPLFPDCSRLIAIGAQRVKGLEVELSGRPVEWIDVLATYAHTLGKVTKSDEVVSGIPVGSRLPEAGKNVASIFAKAALAPIGRPDVALSLGVYYQGPRPGREYFGSFYAGPFATPFRVNPASTRVDIGGYWDMSREVRLQANVTNLFDVRVVEPVNVGYTRPTPFQATVGVRLSL